MDLKSKKRMAASILGVSKKKVYFNPERLSEISESYTREDIKRNIEEGAIVKKRTNEQSRARAKVNRAQKAKGLRKGPGSRKGKHSARLGRKTVWINKIRLFRRLLRSFYEKELIDNKTYRMLYMRAKGGFFRSKRHLLLYMNDQGLFKKKD